MPACTPPAERATHPGRYHGSDDPWPLYAALDEPTIWAEWAHATGGAVRPEDDRRWRCTFEADLAVLDLRDEGTREALGVSLDALTGAWSPDRPNGACRRVMAAAIEAGADAIIVPSAARPGGWSIDVLPRAFGRLRLVSREEMTPAPPHGDRPSAEVGQSSRRTTG